jgi:putative transposase
MARQLRIEFEGAFYHITSGGNLRGAVFFEDNDRRTFLEILTKTKERYSYLLHAYALMGNHYHLLIETPKANISRIMQNVNTSYTVYINRRYQRSGHLFQGRYKGIIVDKDEYLATLSRYIHLNPVRVGIVMKPEEYKWTSYRAYIEKKVEQQVVDTDETLAVFSGKRGKAKEKYRAFIDAEIAEEESPFRETEAGIMLGRGNFKEKIRGILALFKRDGELPQLKRLAEEKSLDEIVKACGEHYELATGELIRRRRGLPARQATIYLSKILSGRTNKAIGEYFCIKGMAVSRAIKATEEKIARDSILGQQIAELKERILSVR